MRQKIFKLGGRQAWLIWGLCVIFVIWLFNLQTGYAVLSPKIQDSLGLSIAQIGLVGAIYTWAFAIVQFISGPLLDRFGLRKTLPMAVLMVALGAFLYSNAHTVTALYAAQIVIAFGSAFGFVGAGFAGGKWFSAAKYGLMFGLVQSFASLGSAFGEPATSYLSDKYDWRSVLFGFCIFGIILFVCFLIFIRDPKTSSKPVRSKASLFTQIVVNLANCLRKKDVLLSSLIAGVSFGIMLSVGVLWGPRIFEAYGFTKNSGVLGTGLLWLGLACGAPIFNIWSDRLKKRKMPIILGLIAQFVVLIFIIYSPISSEPLLLGLMFLLGFTAGVHMLGFTVAGEVVSGALIGTSAAIVNACCFIFGGVANSWPAHLLPSTGTLSISNYHSALILMPIALVVALLASLALKESFGLQVKLAKK